MDMNETVNSLSPTSIVSMSLVAGDDLSEAGCLKHLLRQCSSFLKVSGHCQEQSSLRDVKEKSGVIGGGQMNQSGMARIRPIPKDVKRMNCHSLTLNHSKFKSKTTASNLLQTRLKFIKRRLLSKISLKDLRRCSGCSPRELKCLGKMENSNVEVNLRTGEESSWQERIKDRKTTTNMLNQLLKKGLETSYWKTSNSPKRLLFGGVNSTRMPFHHEIVGNHTVVPWKLVCSNSECDPEYQINAAFLICRSGTNYKCPTENRHRWEVPFKPREDKSDQDWNTIPPKSFLSILSAVLLVLMPSFHLLPHISRFSVASQRSSKVLSPNTPNQQHISEKPRRRKLTSYYQSMQCVLCFNQQGSTKRTTIFSQSFQNLLKQMILVTPNCSKTFQKHLTLSLHPSNFVPQLLLPSLPKVDRKLMTVVTVLLLTVVSVADGAKTGGFRCKDTASTLACLPNNYSKYELPIQIGHGNIQVDIQILIDEVLRINDKDYSITFSCYFNAIWPDRRVFLRPEFGVEQARSSDIPTANITNNPAISVPMNLEMVKDLWLPNIFIYNLKTYKVMDVLNKLAGLWIQADYKVMFSQATHITFICPMHFDKFPLDTQICKFQVGSYSYDDTIMKFRTESAGYSKPQGNSIALDYAIKINKLSPKDSVWSSSGSLGNFSLAGFELVLSRYVSTYIITYYLPSGLFVIVSWISFLIPMDVIPGRMALLVTLFLVLVNIFNTVTTNTPKAEGLTAIEAWMLACILFVFGALIE